jgi:hypothetical protein
VRVSRLLLVSVPVAVLGCNAATPGTDAIVQTGGEESGSEGVPDSGVIELATPDDWSLASGEEDPFPMHRPQDASCDGGFGPEYGTFEIDTGVCTYGSFVQPTLADIREGDEIRVTLVHDPLWAEEPATAHVAVSLDAVPFFDMEVPIPSQYGFLQESSHAARDVAVGAVLHLHLHNHGYNTYRVVEIAIVQ